MTAISIIVPVYQAEKYLSKCLDSLVHQNLDEEYEVLCVDDGSTDESASIIKQYGIYYPQIRYFYQNNQGVSAARNKGLQEATGKYVMFVDADDWIRKNSLRFLFQKAEVIGTDILVFGGCVDKCLLTPDWVKEALFTKNSFYENDSCTALFYESGAKPSVCNKLFNREFLGSDTFLKNIVISEDLAFLFKLYPRAKKILFSSRNIYQYRISNETSAMHNAENKKVIFFKNHLQTVNFVLAEWRQSGILAEQRENLQNWVLSFLDYIYVTLTDEEKDSFKNELSSIFKELGFSIDDAFCKINTLHQEESLSLKKIKKSFFYQFKRYGLYYGTISFLSKLYMKIKNRI